MRETTPTEAALLQAIDLEGELSPHHRAVIVSNFDCQIASRPATVSRSHFVSCHIGKRAGRFVLRSIYVGKLHSLFIGNDVASATHIKKIPAHSIARCLAGALWRPSVTD